MRAIPILILWLLILCGCAHRRPAGVNYFVGPECRATAEMRDCDTASPPKCKTVAMTYRKGCEQMRIAPKPNKGK